MGTPEFAEISLRRLLEFTEKYEITMVVTQPDKPQGRKKLVLPLPVKALAQENNLRIFQPKSLKSDKVFDILKNENPDFIVVVAYGKILPKKILDLPKIAAINVHASLLPKYRGAAPIQWSFIRGEKIFGVTTMFMEERLDAGNIIFQRELLVNNDENFLDIYPKLGKIGSDLLVETLDYLSADQESVQKIGIKQDDSEATFAPMLEKSVGKINWGDDARKIHNLVRGCCSWPVAYTFLDGKLLKIYKSKISKVDSDGSQTKLVCGAILSDNPLQVQCGNGTILEVVELQLEGKRKMMASEFCRGNNLKNKILA